MPFPEARHGSALASSIVKCLLSGAKEADVADVRIGLGYTAVSLADGRTGVAYTFRDEAKGGCTVFRGIRPLCGRSAADLLQLLESSDVIEAGIGLATANALANRPHPDHLPGDVLEHLEIRPEDSVAMVGHFGPLVNELKKRARSLAVFERVAEPVGLLRPWQEALDWLPQCQVALLTATSIINHTADALLDAARACRETAILGASTPLLPRVFHEYPRVTLSGVTVVDPRGILRVVSEGGGTRFFRPHVNKVTIRPAFQGGTKEGP